jgi:succinoglycan biosynthesis transport protein ExoP
MATNLESGVKDRDRAGGMAFDTLLAVLRRRVGLILLAVIVAAGGALGLSLLQDKRYSATASILPQTADANQELFGSPTTSPNQQAVNFGLATPDVIERRAARRLEAKRQLDTAAAVSSVKVSAQGGSESTQTGPSLIKVKATAKQPATAARAANAFADEFVAFQRDAERARIRQTRLLLKSELARLSAAKRRAAKSAGGTGAKTGAAAQRIRSLTQRIRTLQSRSEDLTILSSLQTGNAAVIDRATPPASPSSPKPARNTLIGVFAGLLVGLGLALVREQQDRRLRDPKELEEAFGVPVLARLPESRALGRQSNVIHDLPPYEAEGFRMLRANLRYLEPSREINSVLVTSPSVEDGKSTVAFHLAAGAAATGLDVLLIEADVRRPVLGRLLGLPVDEGLLSVLSGKRVSLGDVCHEVLLPRSTNGGSAPTMDVVPVGHVTPDASELIESERMRELISEAKRNYALVVIDAPPAGLVSDAIPLMSQVSAVIVVGRMGRITSKDAGSLREQLDKINAPTIGVVANFTSAENGYGLVNAPRSRA